MKKYLLLAVLLLAVLSAACVAQTQDQQQWFRVNLEPDGVTQPDLHFYCSPYKAECLQDVAALRKVLAPYPLHLLGER